MKTITALAAKKLGKFLAKDFRRVFGPAHDDMAERFQRNSGTAYGLLRVDGAARDVIIQARKPEPRTQRLADDRCSRSASMSSSRVMQVAFVSIKERGSDANSFARR